MYALYNLLTAAGMLLLLPYFLVRGLARGKYLDNLRERLGWRFPAELEAGLRVDVHTGGRPGGRIWLHAVSVGEVLAALPLARAIKQRYPERSLVISTTTKTGQELARERMSFADAIFYFPLDWPGPVKRALRAVAPDAVIVMETEIWPNFLRQCRLAGVPVVFANGRLSHGSFRGFRRAMRMSAGVLRGFLKRILNDATLYLMQSEQDAERLVALGADPAKVAVAGNLKYDLAEPAATPFSDWLAGELTRNGRAPVIVAGSVAEQEAGPVLRAFAEVESRFPRAVLIVAPRKPEHFDGMGRAIAASRELVRRSSVTINGSAGGTATLAAAGSALLLDSVGELAGVYRVADAVFVGGSLIAGGGHNILEPAALGRVPVYGTSMENFAEMSARFLGAGAAVQVRAPQELGAAWNALLSAPERAREMGAAARRLVEQNRGATGRVLERIGQVLGGARSRV